MALPRHALLPGRHRRCPVTGRIRADATFTMIPEWVLYGRIPDPDPKKRGQIRLVSDRAVRLYGVLRRYADLPDGAIPSRGLLAERMACSTDSVDRAVRELEVLGAVAVEHCRTEDGDQTSNRYHLRSTPPALAAGGPPEEKGGAAPVRPPRRKGAATPLRTGAALEESEVERDPPSPPHAGGRCRRHPEGAPTGVACRACGSDRASRERQARLAASAAASAAAAARAAGRTGLGAERDPDAGTRGAAAARAASRWGRPS